MSDQRDKLTDRDNLVTIIESCEKIVTYTDGMSWDDFIQKSYIVEACALNCMVMGERAHKLSYEFKQTYDGVPWIELENFRHRIAHTYGTDVYDIRILWNTIKVDIPNTLEYCRATLNEYDGRSDVHTPNRKSFFKKR